MIKHVINKEIHATTTIKIWSEISRELEYNQYIQRQEFLMKWMGGFTYGWIWACIRRRRSKGKL
jgi:hypothetical protein